MISYVAASISQIVVDSHRILGKYLVFWYIQSKKFQK